MKDPKTPQNQADLRTERLRSALRDNLKRRKAQARGRGALGVSARGDEPAESGAEPSNPPDFTPTGRNGG